MALDHDTDSGLWSYSPGFEHDLWKLIEASIPS
jgi:hypothetical protein